jgi:hypothetical protein
MKNIIIKTAIRSFLFSMIICINVFLISKEMIYELFLNSIILNTIYTYNVKVISKTDSKYVDITYIIFSSIGTLIGIYIAKYLFK